MISKLASSSILGVEGYIVEVETDVRAGLPGTIIVGLADTAVQESKERVKSAIKNSGFVYPTQKIVVNLAPADIKKVGPVYDLPIALGILIASEQIEPKNLKDFLIVGELSLDGSVKPIHGVLPYTISAYKSGYSKIIVPKDNSVEASLVEGIKVYPVSNLKEAIDVLINPSEFLPLSFDINKFKSEPDFKGLDFNEIKNQHYAKRCLEIAAAGSHNILMIGPPGSGKTMLARRIPTILPPMTFKESLETSKIYSVAGLLPDKSGLITTRPFRSPHHSISNAGLVGGSSIPKPGEVSLSHNGVLFLDELLEFKREVLEVLRQPLEDRVITIARAQLSITYPANFMLVASLNPCPCGFRGDSVKQCVCTTTQVERYWHKLSGPLLDRIDIHLEVPRLRQDELLKETKEESSYEIRKRVIKARSIQLERFKESGIYSNSSMSPADIKKYCKLDNESKTLLRLAINKLNLSARAYDRILKVARTIADLAGSKYIQASHIAEAIQYRTLDRQRIAA